MGKGNRKSRKAMIFLMRWLLCCFLFLHQADPTYCVPCGRPYRPPKQHHNNHINRVIGGEEALIGTLPWMVMLTENGAQVCGGSLISDKLVLTAAHCFEDHGSLDPKRWRAIVGKHHLFYTDLTQQTHTINRIIMHEGYDNHTVRNDIAILVLDNHVMFNSYVMPVCLPGAPLSSFLSHHSHSHTSIVGIVAGWGETHEPNPKYVLNQVSIPILSDRVCGAHTWYGSAFLPQTTFCAGYEQGGKDACIGDSGGPFIIQDHSGYWVQVGITSWGYGCGHPRSPGIYTDVTIYLTWIKEKAEMYKTYFPYFGT